MAITAAPDTASLLALGRLLAATGRPAQAAWCLQRAIQLDGRDPAHHVLLGRLHLALHQYEPALAAWRQALALAPHLTALRYDLGLACFQAGRYREAADELSIVVQQWPDDTEVRYLLGLAWKEAGHPAQAIAHLEQVIQRAPRHTQALYALGACHLQLGHSMTGMTYLQQYDRLTRP